MTRHCARALAAIITAAVAFGLSALAGISPTRAEPRAASALTPTVQFFFPMVSRQVNNHPTVNWFVAYGDSVVSGALASDADHMFINIIGRTRRARIDNFGVGGSGIEDQFALMKTWPVDTPNVIWMLSYDWLRARKEPGVYFSTLNDALTFLSTKETIYLSNNLRLAPKGYAFYGGSDEMVDAFNLFIVQIAAEHRNVILVDVSSAYHPERG